MDKFYEAGQNIDVFAGIAAEASAQHQQQWTDAFAPAAQNVSSDGIHERDRGIKVFVDLVFDTFQFASIGFPDIGHRLNGRRRGAFIHSGILGQPQV